MTRLKGELNFNSNLEMYLAAPLDSRGVVELLSDLTVEETWITDDGNKYTYPGMITVVSGDTEENNGIYRLKQNPITEINNWIKVESSASVDTYTKTEIDDKLIQKQETLVSGTNIKTVNNQSILGEGNIVIEGAGITDAPSDDKSYVRKNAAWEALIIDSISDSVSFTATDVVNNKINITHNKKSTDVVVAVYSDANLLILPTEIKIIDADNIELDLTDIVVENTWKVVIQGGEAITGGNGGSVSEVAWGDISGDITSQIDLQDSLSDKVDVKIGFNVFNPKNAIVGTCVRDTGLVSSTQEQYATTDFIEVIENEPISINFVPPHINFYNALYDENKNYIEGTITKEQTLQYVMGAKYAVFSITTDLAEEVCVSHTEVPQNQLYTPIGGYPVDLTSTVVPLDFINTDNIVDTSITTDKLRKYFNQGELVDYWNVVSEIFYVKDLIEDERIVFKIYNNVAYFRAYSRTDGSLQWQCSQSLTSYKNNELIELRVVIAGAVGVVGELRGYIVFKDIDLAMSSEYINPSAGFELSDDIINLSFSPIIASAIIEKATANEYIEITAPDEIVAVVDDNLQLFYTGMLDCTNPENYDVSIVCSIGNMYPKYYSLKPTSVQIGDYSLNIIVRNNEGVTLNSKTVTLKVIPAKTNVESPINVLCMGASATASGIWAGELSRRLTTATGDSTDANPTGLGLSNIDFIGRLRGSVTDIPLEATGGWSWNTYTTPGEVSYRLTVTGVNTLHIGDTYGPEFDEFSLGLTITEINVTEGEGNIRCKIVHGDASIVPIGILLLVSGNGDYTINCTDAVLEAGNPFWNANTNKLDFKNYSNSYCDGKDISVMISQCGVNSLSTDIEVVEEQIKTFLRAYKADYPNGKFILGSVPIPNNTGGTGANYGASASYALQAYTGAVAVRKMARSFMDIQKSDEFKDWVYYGNIVGEFDAEHLYPVVEVPTSNRSVYTELRGSNAYHPTTVGSYTVADSYYRIFNKI